MISQQIETIHTSIAQDPALRQRLDKVADKEAYFDLVVEVGKSKGIAISAADVKRATDAVSANRAPAGSELSDQQLESVAGGGFFSQWYYDRYTSGLVKCS